MSELTVTLLRFGFLALLWVMILGVVLTQGRDLSVDRRRRRASARSGQQRRGASPAQDEVDDESGSEPADEEEYEIEAIIEARHGVFKEVRDALTFVAC